MSDHILKIRRKIMSMGLGESATLQIPGVAPQEIEAQARAFARTKKRPISVEITPTGVVLTRIEAEPKASTYPEIDALEVGGSHLFEVPSPFHQRIRLAASNRNRQGKVRLTCTVEAGGIRVTRLPLHEGEATGPIELPKRKSKYELERLATQHSIRFEVTRQEQAKLRIAVSGYALRQGWTIRCRLQDDGTMLVYRTDSGTPGKAAAA
jgi:Fe2+ transport system protein FeoA